ncbi:MAG: hypothetical protein KAS12_01675 [Candidatus Aenigmarchaeota archaeon]|nr:hypothetical protein [Candidatus Aenigmarchaeota archaeon]
MQTLVDHTKGSDNEIIAQEKFGTLMMVSAQSICLLLEKYYENILNEKNEHLTALHEDCCSDDIFFDIKNKDQRIQIGVEIVDSNYKFEQNRIDGSVLGDKIGEICGGIMTTINFCYREFFENYPKIFMTSKGVLPEKLTVDQTNLALYLPDMPNIKIGIIIREKP